LNSNLKQLFHDLLSNKVGTACAKSLFFWKLLNASFEKWSEHILYFFPRSVGSVVGKFKGLHFSIHRAHLKNYKEIYYYNIILH
jgi:hypothetical protein